TLTGRVLPIGGLKEKALAAMRHGIKTVIIPEKNRKDLEEIPAEIRDQLDFIPVRTIDEVLEIALVGKSKSDVKSHKTSKRRMGGSSAAAAAAKGSDE
ncbi:MAG: endopeptidase La, partial [Proteobacteria bacterium]